MRALFSFMTAVFVIFGLLAFAAVKPPDKLVFKTAMGDVTFLHATHVPRVKGDCAACHDKLFPQSAQAPLNWKAGMHKPAEASKTSCGACHVTGGAAFASMGNCVKCHVKG
ncbi:MAG: hypothetical protein EHM65_02935 [Acidobacteriales bacterium]|nr:MAG: hypothetical protein EHM65_02935 [Terriglobales bacterium]